MPRRPSPAEIEEIYRVRKLKVAALSRLPEVDASDLLEMDRLGLCMVASDLWTKCTPAARARLLNDAHPHVRSCASLSAAACEAKQP